MFEKLIKSFKIKNISVIIANTSEDARNKILEMIPEKSIIGFGGSTTLDSVGLLNNFREGNYKLLDRTKYEKGSKEIHEIQRLAQHSDFFLSGCNAITENGKIIIRETNGNRVSSLIYGPEKVIIVVGKNKIVKDLDEGIERAKMVSVKLAKKLNKKTPCVQTGKCVDCSSPERICCYTAVIEKQVDPSRMTVVLINENLGI